MKISVKAIFDALNILKAADPKAVEGLAADLENLEQVEKAGNAHGTGGATTVEDTWQEGECHRVPGREKIITGPSESASGSGAERMTRQYSEPTPQQGLALEAQKLGQLIASLSGSTKKSLETMQALFKGLDERVTGLTDAVTSLATIVKSMPVEDEDDSSTTALARSLIGEVRELVESLGKAKADLAKAEDEDDDEDEKKSCKAKVKSLKKAITEKLEQAVALNSIAKSEKVAKSIKSLAGRAEVTIKALEAEVESEAAAKAESEKKAAEEAAAKAAAGGSAAGTGAAAEASPEATKALTDATEQVRKALDGLGMLTTNVQGFLSEITAAAAKGPMKVPPATMELMKGDVNAVADRIAENIEKAADAGALNLQQEVRAKDLLAKFQAARTGQMAEATFVDLLRTAPEPIKEVFKLAA